MHSMPSVAAPSVRNLILKMLMERAYRPTELFQQLHKIDESALKDVLAALIDAHLIELSPDRHIKLRQQPPASPARAGR